ILDKLKILTKLIHLWGLIENKVTVFFFEAFDESWKGAGTEGHWGLFSEGRKAKQAMREWYPQLHPDGPTSPGYPEEE
ncbi:hypothetical protein H8E88_01560, partial [candidate division KSB1 bacterium]|nr:hypothetical protein [candidate division KSB1 bacterium]